MDKLGTLLTNQGLHESTTNSTSSHKTPSTGESLTDDQELQRINEQSAKQVLARMVKADAAHQKREADKMSDVWVLAIFKKLQARYLHKWTSAIEGIEEEVMREWGQVLRGLTGEQVKGGFDRLSSDWPPTASEFRAICLNKQSNGLGIDYVPSYYRDAKPTDAKQLETDRSGHMTASKDTVENSMASLRESLKGKK